MTQRTYDELVEQASNYQTKNSFRSKNHRWWKLAKDAGILEEVCAHMAKNISSIKMGIRISGLYFLYQDDKLVYIGKSHYCTRSRILMHKNHSEKVFNNAKVFKIKDKNNIHILEAYYIATLKPVLNIEHVTEGSPSLVISNIEELIEEIIYLKVS